MTNLVSDFEIQATPYYPIRIPWAEVQENEFETSIAI